MRIIWFLFIVFTLFSCQSKYPGFSKEGDVYYKIHTIGDEQNKVNEHAFCIASYSITTLDNKLISSDSNLIVALNEFEDKAIKHSLLMMSQGDSFSFIIKKPNPYFKDSLMDVQLNILVKNVFTEDEFEQNKKEIESKADTEMNEQIILRDYLLKNQIDSSALKDSIYFLYKEEGKGRYLQLGDIVTIDYEGFFLNGKKFDSTYDRRTPFEFKFGDPDQILPGIVIALAKMKLGGKVKIIIPSQFAFGEKGSSFGSVPPFTTVIYEVKLIKVNQSAI